ncbi:hypothetical protein D3C86_1662260 [compost metagenome]
MGIHIINRHQKSNQYKQDNTWHNIQTTVRKLESYGMAVGTRNDHEGEFLFAPNEFQQILLPFPFRNNVPLLVYDCIPHRDESCLFSLKLGKMVECTFNFSLIDCVNEVSTTYGSEGSNEDVKKDTDPGGDNNNRLNRL